MKKTLVAGSLLILAAVLGFSNVSWAVNRPNTPECADVNGRSDIKACLIQYVEPLRAETEQMWNRLMKLQGKKVKDNPWTFKVDSPACDSNNQYYDKTFCLLQTPGRLAVEKYRIREEIMKLEVERKIKRPKTKIATAKVATIGELTKKNDGLARRLEEAERKNTDLLKQNETLSQEIKKSRDQLKKMFMYAVWYLGVGGELVIILLCLGAVIINLRSTINSLRSRVENLEERLLAEGEKKPGNNKSISGSFDLGT